MIAQSTQIKEWIENKFNLRYKNLKAIAMGAFGLVFKVKFNKKLLLCSQKIRQKI